jgi:hypothetical protein
MCKERGLTGTSSKACKELAVSFMALHAWFHTDPREQNGWNGRALIACKNYIILTKQKSSCPVLTMQKFFCPSRNCLDTTLDEVFSAQKKKAQMLKI